MRVIGGLRSSRAKTTLAGPKYPISATAWIHSWRTCALGRHATAPRSPEICPEKGPLSDSLVRRSAALPKGGRCHNAFYCTVVQYDAHKRKLSQAS